MGSQSVIFLGFMPIGQKYYLSGVSKNVGFILTTFFALKIWKISKK